MAEQIHFDHLFSPTGKDCLGHQDIAHNTRNVLTDEKKSRSLGSIYTPLDFVQLLTAWAIQKYDQKVLDIGIGEGAFVFTAYNHLIALGATPDAAADQLYGAEIDVTTYEKFSLLSTSRNICFPHLYNKDFFDINFPKIDVIIGNPPYVRRTYIDNIDEIRKNVMKRNSSITDSEIHRLTDLYVYFLLQALPLLKPGGRLAVITADAWLNVGYGKILKKYLLQYCHIESLISLDRRVFDNAEVKPIFLLATKKEQEDIDQTIHFVRVKNGFPIKRLFSVLESPENKFVDIIHTQMKNSELRSNHPWGIYFKAPQVYEEIASHELTTPIANIAETRIGLQTLAKEFFILSLEQATLAHIEPEFLKPIAQSLRYFDAPVIEPGTPSKFYVFFCSKSKEELQGTHALQYIDKGEITPVQVRGKDITLIGYHNKERIQRSHRKYWYDLKTRLESRGLSPILIPRLIYHKYQVIWNQACFIPGELFIEFSPKEAYDLEVFLAILNSTVSEILLRSHAHVYGGGTYNINPGSIKKIPILNVALLTDQQRMQLKQAYLYYLQDQKHERAIIDDVIYNILGMGHTKKLQMKTVLEDLLLLASSAKKAHSASDITF